MARQTASLARTWASSLCATLLVAGAAGASPARYVVPPATEPLVSSMLCDAPALPKGCACSAVSIDRSVIVASYACGGESAVIELHHPTAVAKADAETSSFALVRKGAVPEALFHSVAARVRAGEPSWKWAEVTPGAGSVPEVLAPHPEVSERERYSAAQLEELEAGTELYARGHYAEALALMDKLARETPKPRAGVLGLAVAALASTSPGADEVRRYVAEAERDPRDLVNQFLAGVAAHSCGHRRAASREEKAKYYALAVTYLSRTLPDLAEEPRVHLYLALSHYRLGHQAEAERFAEQAVALGDADSYYGRAEVHHQKDVPKAIADVERYLQLTEERRKKEGALLGDGNQAQVRRLAAALRAVPQGQQPPPGLFDPLPSVSAEVRAGASPGVFAAVTATLGAFAASIWFTARRGRRRVGM